MSQNAREPSQNIASAAGGARGLMVENSPSATELHVEELTWWHPIYTVGDKRKTGPWFTDLDDAKAWTQKLRNLTEAMRPTVRYESVGITVEGSPKGVAAALARLVAP